MALRNKKRVYAAAAVLLLVVVLVPLSSLTLMGKGAVRDAMAPAQRGSTGILRRISEAWSAVCGFGGMLEKNRDLSRELVRVNAELSRWRAAEEENVRLRKALGFYEEQSGQIIACDVIGREISGWWNTIRLGKGKQDGVREGQAVISPDGLVGRTTEVTAHTADVLLLSDPTCQVSAKIERMDVFGLVRGAGTTLKGEPKAIIEFINKDKEIRVNDEVVTSGLGAFPQGLHIGYITHIKRDDSGLFQQAEITPLPTIGLLDYLFVVPSVEREVAE